MRHPNRRGADDRFRHNGAALTRHPTAKTSIIAIKAANLIAAFIAIIDID